MALDRLALCMNTAILGPTQYANYNFASMCRLGDGRLLGANEDGLFELESGHTDAGAEIDAFFELRPSDLGTEEQKRIRMAYVSAEAAGDLQVGVRYDEGQWRDGIITPSGTSNRQQGARVPLPRADKGQHVAFRVQNLAGADFSVDLIRVAINALGRRPRR